jgi:hypothetical protein
MMKKDERPNNFFNPYTVVSISGKENMIQSVNPLSKK